MGRGELKQLWDTHFQLVFDIIHKYGIDEVESGNLTSDVFFQLYKKVSSGLIDEQNILSFLKTTARELSINHIKNEIWQLLKEKT